MKVIFAIWSVWVVLHLLIFFIIPSFIPYLGNFPYKEIATQFKMPSFINSMANFDGVHFLSIVQSGYLTYDQAFFPLYPTLIGYVDNILGRNSLLAGFIISNISFLVGLLVFKEYLKLITKDSKILGIFLIFLAFPTSFFFMAVYTEGLFFLLTISTLYFLKKENYWLAAVCGFLAALTRLVGVFLIVPVLIHLFFKLQKKPLNPYLPVAPLISPLLGLGTYCFYLWRTTKDPLFFLNSQSAFGANRSSDLVLFPRVIYRYIKIFINNAWDFQYFIATVEFVIFCFFFGVLTYELWKMWRNKAKEINETRLGLNLFSFANLLLPTFTGTFSSIPRYVLMSFSVFIVLGEIENRYVKIALLILFGIFQILLFGYFIQGYFVS